MSAWDGAALEPVRDTWLGHGMIDLARARWSGFALRDRFWVMWRWDCERWRARWWWEALCECPAGREPVVCYRDVEPLRPERAWVVVHRYEGFRTHTPLRWWIRAGCPTRAAERVDGFEEAA